MSSAVPRLFKKASISEAENFLHAALMEAETSQDEMQVALSLDKSGRSLFRAGQNTTKLNRCTSATAHRERVLEPEHEDIVASLNNLSALYFFQEKHGDAEPLCRQLTPSTKRCWDREHAEVGRNQSQQSRSVAQGAKEIRRKRSRLFKRSLLIMEKALGLEHADVGTSLNHLATLYQEQNKFAEAELLYERALAILETALGAESPELAEPSTISSACLSARQRGTS